MADDLGHACDRGPVKPVEIEAAPLRSVRRRWSPRVMKRLFQMGDCLALGLAALMTDQLVARGTAGVFLISALPLALMLVWALQDGLPRPSQRYLLRAATAAVAPALGLLVSLPLAGLAPVPLVTVTAWAVFASGLMMLTHLVWGLIVQRGQERGRLMANILIVGATPTAITLIERSWQDKTFRVLGVFDDREARVGREVLGIPVLGRARDLVGHELLPFVDHVLVTVPPTASARIAELVQQFAAVPNPIGLLLEPRQDAPEYAADRIADFSVAKIAGDRPRGSVVAKRSMDLLVSGGALLLLAPALLLIAIAIKLDSPGPIFFRQRRHGYLNEEFWVWKFRSMRVEAQDDNARVQVRAADPRVTRVGRIIRSTSLDELPQLVNVLRGEMSLVGPRPHAIGMLAEGRDATSLVESYAHRHRIKPGLTGWAAVKGSRGPADSAAAIRRRVELDLEYIQNQSFWFDVQIILRTIPCLLGDRRSLR